jgi:hypothetical protein
MFKCAEMLLKILGEQCHQDCLFTLRKIKFLTVLVLPTAHFSLPVRGASSVMQNAGGSECTSQPCLKTQSEKRGGGGAENLQQGKEGLYSHKIAQ